jgi:RES domain
VVEAQHVVSTRKLVDSDAEQVLLEELIDRAKPPAPPEPEFAGLHYLLTTPFRYPPLRHGSRFGTRTERGLWYGSETLPTAFAETAYYRLLFLAGTSAELEPLLGDVSAFAVAVRTERGVDLTASAFTRHQAEISSPSRYDLSQRLGREMRADGVEACRYRSARDAEGVANLALFTPRAFAARRPSPPEAWLCAATREAVEFSPRDVLRHGDRRKRRARRYLRAQFLVDDRLPAPAL